MSLRQGLIAAALLALPACSKPTVPVTDKPTVPAADQQKQFEAECEVAMPSLGILISGKFAPPQYMYEADRDEQLAAISKTLISWRAKKADIALPEVRKRSAALEAALVERERLLKTATFAAAPALPSAPSAAPGSRQEKINRALTEALEAGVMGINLVGGAPRGKPLSDESRRSLTANGAEYNERWGDITQACVDGR